MGQMHQYGAPDNRRSGIKVFLATPCYDMVSSAYCIALMAACVRLEREGIEFNMYLLAGNCHVDDGRNRLVRDFLETDCTDLLFLDADMKFNPADVVKILKYDRDVVAGTYPYKQAEEDYPVELLPEGFKIEADGLAEVLAVPTGFLRIRRSVLEKLYSMSPKFPAKNDHPSRIKQPVIFERIMADGRRLGGDYAFCWKWRSLGGKIYIDPKMYFEHYGETSFNGSYSSFVRRKDGDYFRSEVESIRAGTENVDTIVELAKSYGNGFYTVMPELIQTAIIFARQAKKGIFETGSGLSTIVMAAANPNVQIISLEHSKEWATMTTLHLERLGLTNAKVLYAPLKDYGPFMWYDWSPNGQRFDMVFCDGPTRRTKGGRSGIHPIMEKSVEDGATLLFDDYDKFNEIEILRWGGKINRFGVERFFAVTQKNTINQSPTKGESC